MNIKLLINKKAIFTLTNTPFSLNFLTYNEKTPLIFN
ncbi:hypothetical protein SAMN05216464_102663 [Mucilaginibacter pineti]|uniref:Uncharacterized protein n=1 Tax=Mucilaginibacter pineti TaxID=1391627 RepID=A0A1G6XV86_9SPHI|nr:hypothetical protein SAMN05216464_102663 [Mucilaginibacter pineti]